VTVNGFPRAGVSVALTRGGALVASLVSANTGGFEFVGIEPGFYSVVISNIVGVSCDTLRAATVQGGKRTDVNFACVSPPRGSVMGRVTRNGIGLARVEVYLCDSRSWWGGCFPVQFTNPQGFYAYDILHLVGIRTYFLFANCEPATWSGALVGPTSAQVVARAGMQQTVNFECP
jgi:hypothetical protein